jgi:hypothetical protein
LVYYGPEYDITIAKPVFKNKPIGLLAIVVMLRMLAGGFSADAGKFMKKVWLCLS